LSATTTHGQIPVGIARSVVPATLDAWLTVLRRWGTVSFGDVAAAAAISAESIRSF
jgi:gamma-glutamyltranspeptidase/glutathione hydrolase